MLVAPPPPKPIAKGRFTAGFLARLLVEKLVPGRPTHRVAGALGHDGQPEGTLAGLFADLSALLVPLAERIGERNAAAAHVHADEPAGRCSPWWEGKDSNRWWLWVFLGPDTKVFRIARSRSSAVLAEHLGVDPDTG